MLLPHGPFEQLHAYYQFLVPGLTEESWNRCQSVLTLKEYKKGEMVQREGQPCNHISFITRGLIRMYYQAGDKEKIICFLNENNYVCDYHAFLTRRPATSNIQALTDLQLAETRYDDLQALYKEVPEANMMGRIIAEHLFIRLCEEKETDIKATIEERYMLLQQHEPWLLQHVPQYMIASYLGITPEALSRVKSRMMHKRKVVYAGLLTPGPSS